VSRAKEVPCLEDLEEEKDEGGDRERCPEHAADDCTRGHWGGGTMIWGERVRICPPRTRSSGAAGGVRLGYGRRWRRRTNAAGSDNSRRRAGRLDRGTDNRGGLNYRRDWSDHVVNDRMELRDCLFSQDTGLGVIRLCPVRCKSFLTGRTDVTVRTMSWTSQAKTRVRPPLMHWKRPPPSGFEMPSQVGHEDEVVGTVEYTVWPARVIFFRGDPKRCQSAGKTIERPLRTV
jgi:hypothetical protein